MNSKAKYRHELKYLINHRDKELLCARLSGIMQRDANTVDGRYKIRSLYFDDYWMTAYRDKMMGVFERKKYRIRIYNDSDSNIKLECKMKSGNYIHKKAVSLTRDETDMILRGDYGFLLKKEKSMYHEFYYQCVSRVLRPCVIVDYEREPFVCEAGDVRITFDTDVRSTVMFSDFFRSDLPSVYALEPGTLIMEVKYTELLPNIIRKALPAETSGATAASKFTMCYENSAFYHAFNDSFN